MTLEAFRTPYILKCPYLPEMFDRVDAFVVYLSSRGWFAARPALRAVHDSVAGRLHWESPPLTFPLGPGVAAGEDPQNGMSFGQSRSRAVADGLLRAVEARYTDSEAIAAIILRGFPFHGISPGYPYLQFGSPRGLITEW
jgi:hypothetical protein